MEPIEAIVDALRESPREAIVILGVLGTIGYVARRLTNARDRHLRLHPRGLNSSPDTAPSIIATGGGDAGCADGGGCGDGGGGGD